MTGVHGARHGALYAYLEDVQPDGRVTYLTEGELALADRAIAPKKNNPPWSELRTPRTYARADASPFPLHTRQQITFDLLPTSVQFHPGDRIRIAIAAANPDSFQLLPADGNATYWINHGPASLRSSNSPSSGEQQHEACQVNSHYSNRRHRAAQRRPHRYSLSQLRA